MVTASRLDRLSLTALAVADVGVGVFLMAVGQVVDPGIVHTIVGVISLLLALPAAAVALTGRLPRLADEGMLVNVGVMLFATMEVATLPAAAGQRAGLVIFWVAAVLATVGLYLRMFGALRLPPAVRGRHHDD